MVDSNGQPGTAEDWGDPRLNSSMVDSNAKAYGDTGAIEKRLNSFMVDSNGQTSYLHIKYSDEFKFLYGRF